LSQSNIQSSNAASVKKIAVIGSNLNGLIAAWNLGKRHNVSVFIEGNKPAGFGPISLYNGSHIEHTCTDFLPQQSPELVKILHELKLDTQPHTSSCCISLSGQSINSRLNRNLQARPKRLLQLKFWQLAHTLYQLKNHPPRQQLSAKKWLDGLNINPHSLDEYIHPFAYAVCGQDWQNINGHELWQQLLKHHHYRFQSPQWRTLKPGTTQIVHALCRQLQGQVFFNTKVIQIIPQSAYAKVQLILQNAKPMQFDHVLIATSATASLNLFSPTQHLITHMLNQVASSTEHSILHRDSSVMPERQELWANKHYQFTHSQQLNTHRWLEEQDKSGKPLFISTINTKKNISQSAIIDAQHQQTTIENQSTWNARRLLQTIQGHDQLWFCANWTKPHRLATQAQHALQIVNQIEQQAIQCH